MKAIFRSSCAIFSSQVGSMARCGLPSSAQMFDLACLMTTSDATEVCCKCEDLSSCDTSCEELPSLWQGKWRHLGSSKLLLQQTFATAPCMLQSECRRAFSGGRIPARVRSFENSSLMEASVFSDSRSYSQSLGVRYFSSSEAISTSSLHLGMIILLSVS